MLSTQSSKSRGKNATCWLYATNFKTELGMIFIDIQQQHIQYFINAKQNQLYMALFLTIEIWLWRDCGR